MPITRREDSTDPLDPYILVLWSKKWLIAAVAIATAILVYVVLLFVPSIYRVNAEVFVNRLPTVQDGETPNPESVVSLLKSQSVLGQVRDDFVKQYKVDPKPPIERFVKQFSVETDILQDTSVRKEYSPVIQLEVESEGAEQTRYIMDRWIHNFISEFGNYTAQEAVMKREAYQEEKELLERAITEIERQQATLDARLPYLRKMLAEKLDLLSPSRLSLQEDEEPQSGVRIDLSMKRPRLSPGLLERYAEAELLQRLDPASTASAELPALQAAIADTQTSITEAEKVLAETLSMQRSIARQAQLLRNTQTAVNDALGRFVVASAVYRNVSAKSDLPSGGDIRALSMPVTPELRVWPKRTTVAGLAGIAAAILTMFAVLARNFLTKISPRTVQ